jgi:hypothetical protein
MAPRPGVPDPASQRRPDRDSRRNTVNKNFENSVPNTTSTEESGKPSQKGKPAHSWTPDLLTPQEIESLRQDSIEASKENVAYFRRLLGK